LAGCPRLDSDQRDRKHIYAELAAIAMVLQPQSNYAMQPEYFPSEMPIPANGLERPTWTLPAGACDAHMHVFGPPAQYPAAVAARYTCPPAPLADYRGMASALGLQRAVFVQPSFYGTDNSCLLDALVQMPNTRGVVMVGAGVSLAQLSEWHAIGVRGLRVDLFRLAALGRTPGEIKVEMFAKCELAARLGWSVDLYVPGGIACGLADAFGTLPCPVSIAHMGYLTVDQASDAQCAAFLDAVESGRVWLKLSGLYRYGPGRGQARAEHLAKQAVARVPKRLLWGSDWPHVMDKSQDAGAMLNVLHRQCGADARLLARILVDNPATLYGW
jgi:predicted TIM-barrel fold metal-dependent hydrolase